MWRPCELRYLIVLLIIATQAESLKKYRDDYVFNTRNNAFYKLHIEHVGYKRAQDVCQVEGGALMVASSIYDTVQVHGMLKNFPDIGDYVWIGDDGDEQVYEQAEELNLFGDEDMLNSYQSSMKCTAFEQRWQD
ncbi:hypothetical protein ACJJTC_011286 [Scirpophaga incertulas]